MGTNPLEPSLPTPTTLGRLFPPFPPVLTRLLERRQRNLPPTFVTLYLLGSHTDPIRGESPRRSV